MISRLSAVAVLLCFATSVVAEDKPAETAKPKEPKEIVTFKDHVAPILRKHCGNCHNPDKATADLDVMTYQTLLAGGSSGETVMPGSPDQSLLYKAVAHIEEPFMPPKAPKIPEAELAVIKKWIELGAPETSVSAVKNATRKTELDLTSVSMGKPEGPPPMPENWPVLTLPHTNRAHPVTALATSPWAPLVAVAGHERILLYNTDDLKLVGVLPFPERIPLVLKFSRNGKVLLAAGGRGANTGKAVLFDVASGKRLAEIGDETDSVLAADISPDQKWVAIGGPAKLVKIFSTETGELKHKIKKHTDWVTSIEFSPNGQMLASGDRNGGVYIWEPETGSILFTLGDHKDVISDMSWRADSQMLATASEDGRVILWFAEDGFPTRTLNATAGGVAVNTPGTRGKPAGVLATAYARNGLLATVGRDNSVRVWKDGNQTAKLSGFADTPWRVVFSHDGERIIAGDFTGELHVWNAKDNVLLGKLTTNP
ncbi:MAG: c-type cytochrome domain-containing protein [Planctomycetota bacterium]